VVTPNRTREERVVLSAAVVPPRRSASSFTG
jgi:hypothetical protein